MRVTRAGWRPGPGSLGGGWGGRPEAAAMGWRQASATVDEEHAQHGDRGDRWDTSVRKGVGGRIISRSLSERERLQQITAAAALPALGVSCLKGGCTEEVALWTSRS